MYAIRSYYEPGDERRAEHRVGSAFPNRSDERADPLPAPPASHRAQQRCRSVLQRQVEVRHDGGQLQHRVGQCAVDLARVEVQEADAREAVVAPPVQPVDRITSYNVCYTKLLRLLYRIQPTFRLVAIARTSNIAIGLFYVSYSSNMGLM